MRLLIEIIIIGGLLYLGWEKPFGERMHQLRGSSAIKQTVRAVEKALPETPTPTPTSIP
jgi:hypothetical protein